MKMIPHQTWPQILKQNMANNHRNLQAQLKTPQASTRPKFLIELAKPTQKKNCFKKISNASKKNKTHDTQPDKKALDK